MDTKLEDAARTLRDAAADVKARREAVAALTRELAVAHELLRGAEKLEGVALRGLNEAAGWVAPWVQQ